MINKPGINATESDLVRFVHEWVKLCSAGKITDAFSLLDGPVDESRHTWTPDDIKEVTYNHFDDEKYPIITDPDEAEGNIRKDSFEYNDGSGWGVAYDLPLNGVVSDFTLMFDFINERDHCEVFRPDTLKIRFAKRWQGFNYLIPKQWRRHFSLYSDGRRFI
mgnify:CR=1 FL=1